MFAAEIELVENPAAAREPAWLVMFSRICPMPSSQLGRRIRVDELSAAVDRGVPQVVDTGVVGMIDTSGYGCGHCRVPAASWFMVSDGLVRRQLALRAERQRGEVQVLPVRRIGARGRDVVRRRGATLPVRMSVTQ